MENFLFAIALVLLYSVSLSGTTLAGDSRVGLILESLIVPKQHVNSFMSSLIATVRTSMAGDFRASIDSRHGI